MRLSSVAIDIDDLVERPQGKLPLHTTLHRASLSTYLLQYSVVHFYIPIFEGIFWFVFLFFFIIV